MVVYNRDNPSETYKAHLEDYRKMHVEGYRRIHGKIRTQVKAEDAYQGEQLLNFRLLIKEIIEKTGAKTILDYGCGKGQQYDPMPITDAEGAVVAQSIQEYWGVDHIHRYDPGVKQFWDFPEGEFDGVVSTDVLEHIPVQDIPWVVEEQFSKARKFVFANIACYPALATLPDGSNAHVTVRNPEWWDGLFFALSQNKRDLVYVIVCVAQVPDEDGKSKYSQLIYTNLATEP